LPLSVIVSDLSLYTEVPAGGGSTIAWSTETSSINMTAFDDNPLGKVTRPSGSDENGNLTANLNYNFRDIAVNDSKIFTASIRQAPAILPENGTELAGGTFPDGYVEFIDVSPNGTRAVAGFRGDGGFNVIKRGTGDAPEYVLTTTDVDGSLTSQVFPALYAGKRPIGVQFLDNDRVMIAIPEGEDASANATDGALLIYDVADASIASGMAPLLETIVMPGTIKFNEPQYQRQNSRCRQRCRNK